MAIYHCSMKPVSRSSGRSAVASAAYRSGQCLVNERDGLVHDFSRRDGIEHSEIVMPNSVDAAWAQDRSALWNEAEQAEKRADARVAREFEVALPHELTAGQRIDLTRVFAQDLANRYGAAVDFAIHSPHGKTDIRNHHAHLLMTTRTVTADGLGAKTQIEQENKRLLTEGLPTSQMQLREIRQAWEHYANEHLARAGHEARIDHRSHSERGLEITPTQHMGVQATQMDRQGKGVSRTRLDEAAARRNADLIREKPDQILTIITGEKSVFDRHDVARALHRYVQEPAEFQNAFATVMQSPSLVELRGEMRDAHGQVTELARYSTREMVAIEQGMVDRAAGMAETSGYRVSQETVERALDARPFLADEQKAAIRHVTGEERITAVVGLAGAGKSTMLASAREAWEAEGYRVHGAALAGKAAEGLEESSGIASRTLASWEYGWNNGRGELGSGDILVIDEAGMVSSKQLARFVEETEHTGAKLVLVGDPEQLQPINAGAAFRAVTERIGFVELEEVRRQHEPWQREASIDFARHRTAEGLAAYGEHGAVHFTDTREDARAAIVRDVMQDREDRPDGSRLVLTYRRADVRELNEAIRDELQGRGELAGELTYRTNDGERSFAAGDRILFLENDRDLGVKNGMLGTVTQVEEGRIIAQLDGAPGAGREREVSISTADYAAIDHGYATTIHKSQGATVDRSYVLASGGMDSHLAYVAMTRHRDDVQLYAGQEDFKDMGALASELGRARPKETTLDYAERRGIAHEIDPANEIRVPAPEQRTAELAERLQTEPPRTIEQGPATRDHDGYERPPEPERLSFAERLAAFVGWSKPQPDPGERSQAESERAGLMSPGEDRPDHAADRARNDKPALEHGPEKTQEGEQRPLSLAERMEQFHKEGDGQDRQDREGLPEERSERGDIRERLSELREREARPLERGEHDREHERGGYER
ncbi:Ti-type conjugative transfer relaxase TraA [Consotaella salsifontis]|uniref:Ti-type conjugative transfer relaxase TraA n=1 Tax=Consotaella salsifontis TaxID=1365950 RepID=A0A1T4TFQ2_9HYPH|nr:Ti-type conjugative transfer relaxase TraA [Consotaella salsifontis]SKA39262.1 Ti-type conjugative transfer relaxase TraA [Consotaella salsifontis]